MFANFSGETPLIVPLLIGILIAIIGAFATSGKEEKESYWSPRRIREREEKKRQKAEESNQNDMGKGTK